MRLVGCEAFIEVFSISFFILFYFFIFHIAHLRCQLPWITGVFPVPFMTCRLNTSQVENANFGSHLDITRRA